MGKIKFIGSFLAYIILAGISCWATEKSLHMLLPTGWPEILVWGITIAFFVVASIGSWLIVYTLSSSDFIDNRKLKLCGGILLMLFFWLIMSMPTNTHTFFYNDKIGSVITEDISKTNKYLQQIVNKGSGNSIPLDSIGKEIFDKVEKQRRLIVAEFNGDGPTGKRGNGIQIGVYLEEINKILNSTIQQDPRYNSTDVTILNSYHAQINDAESSALKSHTITEETLGNAKEAKDILTAMQDSIENDLQVGSISEEKIKQVQKLLENGYTIVANNQTFIDFDKETNDKEVYTNPKHETRTKRMASVIDVFFIDFMQGKYPASFWYYILLSLLVDVAAFIFFDIAFNKHH